ncbi:unnamed protein product [Clonostachys rosea f. rosea IK726]|uniref:Major facilitator superfamily (MFS) profile domain-containing protein n=2 Tax=Bionectria ochroleuca TaxID=29856 RepID=A0A0B7KFZ3_BIOOC|nr:unnamed protein product [Clonostachys rosea f. rosea IK726]
MLFRKEKKAEPPAAATAQNEVIDNEAANDMMPTLTATSTVPQHEYPKGIQLVLLLASVFLTMFLVALDRLIIATAIPEITNEFNSLPDVGWYGSAYLLTTCSFQLLFGKLYTFFAVKGVWLISIFIFEVGSAICGAAPNSTAFIIGRAIQGIGGAGIFSGAIVVIVYAVPLEKRPMFQGLFGAIFGLASIIGPLVGGAFTSNVTWRWCFYINLPIGGVAFAFSAFLLRVPDRDTTKQPLSKKLAQLDGVGTAVLIPGVVCLLLALQWGGLEHPWSDGRIIALLVLAGVLLIGFVAVQVLMPNTATIPPHIFKQRSILSGFWATICIGSQMMIFVYYLPIWFQAIQGVSAVDSGIRILPSTLSMVVATIFSGALITRIGYYTPFMIFGTCLMSIGAGLLTTLQVDTGSGKWIGYQVLWGLGMGMTFQAPNLAAQTVLKLRDVPIGTTLMFFSQLMGGAIFISVGQNVLNNELLKRLAPLPGFRPSFISQGGATALRTEFPAELLPAVLDAYNESLRKVFQIGMILTVLTIIGSATMEWKSVKKNVKKPVAAGSEEQQTTTGGAKSDGETIVEGSVARSEKDVDVKSAPAGEASAEKEKEKEEKI